MTKEITLNALDGNTNLISVTLNGFAKTTDIVVRQEADGTKAWYKSCGEEIVLPKTRYTLSSLTGKQELADDLEEMGLLGKHYSVYRSFSNAEWAEHKSIDLSVYYEDSFDVGDFLNDADAIEAVELIQSKHDEAACEALEEAGFDGSLGGDGPCYAAHLYREEEDEDVQVEL